MSFVMLMPTNIKCKRHSRVLKKWNKKTCTTVLIHEKKEKLPIPPLQYPRKRCTEQDEMQNKASKRTQLQAFR